jgi:hypothetical protein
MHAACMHRHLRSSLVVSGEHVRRAEDTALVIHREKLTRLKRAQYSQSQLGAHQCAIHMEGNEAMFASWELAIAAATRNGAGKPTAQDDGTAHSSDLFNVGGCSTNSNSTKCHRSCTAKRVSNEENLAAAALLSSAISDVLSSPITFFVRGSIIVGSNISRFFLAMNRAQLVAITGGKRAYGLGLFRPLVPVAEPESITRDQYRSRFQHEPGPIGLYVDALQRDAPWVNGPGS